MRCGDVCVCLCVHAFACVEGEEGGTYTEPSAHLGMSL